MKTPGKRILMVVVIVFLLLLPVVFSAINSFLTIPSSGQIDYQTSGTRTIYFEDSFEEETPRTFGWGYSYPPEDPPASWGADISDPIASVEVVSGSSAAYHGDIGLYFNCPRAENVTTVYDYIFTRLGYDEIQDVFYVSWYQKFENLPTVSWKAAAIFVMASRTGTLYAAQTGEVTITKESVNINKMYNSGSYSSTSAAYTFESDKWYHFEIMYKYGVTDGEYKLWIDNDVVISSTGMDTTPILGLDYRPAGFEIGLLSRVEDEDYSCWLDDVLVANYPVGNVDITSFETGEYIGPTTLHIPYLKGWLDGHGEVQSFAHSGSSAFHFYDPKDFVWDRDFVPYHSTDGGAPYYQFEDGPLDDHATGGSSTIPTTTLGEVEDSGLLDTSVYSRLHWGNEWLFWDGSKYTDSPTSPQTFNAYPRAILTKGIHLQSKIYQRAYVYFTKLDGYVQLFRFWNSGYVSMLNVRPGSLEVVLYGIQSQIFYVDIPFNEWICLELGYLSATNGYGEVYMNGQLIGRVNGNTASLGQVSNVNTGIRLCNAELDFYLDDWAVDTNYIGP
jgi:hypothetical protein